MVLSITFILPPPSSGPSLGSLHPGSRGAQMALSDFDRCICGSASVTREIRSEDRKCRGRSTTNVGRSIVKLYKNRKCIYIYIHITSLSFGTSWSICMYILYLRKFEHFKAFLQNQQQKNITWPLLAQFEPQARGHRLLMSTSGWCMDSATGWLPVLVYFETNT